MSDHRSRRERDTYDSELKDLEYKYYKRLKDGELKVKLSDSCYRCPYCDDENEEDYTFKQLLRHADHIGAGSRRRSRIREIAQHLALSFYVGKYLKPDDRTKLVRSSKGGVVADIPTEVRNEWGGTKGSLKSKDERTNQLPRSKDEQPVVKRLKNDSVELKNDSVELKNDSVRSKDEQPVAKCLKNDLVELKNDSFGSKDEQPVAKRLKNDLVEPKKDSVESRHGSHSDNQSKFVWPCMGILANIPTEMKDGRRVGDSGSGLRDELTTKGYNPVKVVPIWNHFGHTGFAVVQFRKDWDGYKNALMFEKYFELRRCGREDYYRRRYKGNDLYGWFARERDYRSNEKFSAHLRQKGDLRSISDVTSENERKDSSLFSYLQNTLDAKQEHEKEMEEKYNDTKLSIEEVMRQKESMNTLYNEEIVKMQQSVCEDFKKILLERERAKRDVEARRMELEQQEKQLQEREKLNEHEISNLKQKKEMVLYEQEIINLKQKKEMNEKAILEQKKAEALALTMAQEHQREKEDMRKKTLELQTQLDAKQALELEMEQLRGALQVLGHMNEDDDSETQKQKEEEIIEKLADMKEELEGLEDLNQTLLTKHERVEQELKAGRRELIDGLSAAGKPGRATIGVKKSRADKPGKANRLAAGGASELWNFKDDREAKLIEGIDYICRSWKRVKN
ncbi:Factor of DNA methylation 4 [Linum grandiflorum]